MSWNFSKSCSFLRDFIKLYRTDKEYVVCGTFFFQLHMIRSNHSWSYFSRKYAFVSRSYLQDFLDGKLGNVQALLSHSTLRIFWWKSWKIYTFGEKLLSSRSGKIFSGRMKMFRVSTRFPKDNSTKPQKITMVQNVDKKYSWKTKR